MYLFKIFIVKSFHPLLFLYSGMIPSKNEFSYSIYYNLFLYLHLFLYYY